ncbi:MAG: DNRLRE domain-containing protein [Candidatus Thermoplasmatota archaeon]|nr:DNRLRE domain-containing protein [Candidatus Thermoplasmatota archaeon]
MNTRDRSTGRKRELLHCWIVVIAVYILFLSLLPTIQVQATLSLDDTVQQLLPTYDTYIDQTTPDVSYTTTTNLIVSNAYGNDSKEWERDILLVFNVSELSPYAEITSATLNMYYYDYDVTDPVDRVLSVHHLSTDWDPQNVTWTTRPKMVFHNISSAHVPASYGWMTWDLTEDVRQAQLDTTGIVAWQISDINPYQSYNIPLVKFKATETQTVYSPYLELQYIIPLTVTTTGPYEAYTNTEIRCAGVLLAGGTPPYQWYWEYGDDSNATEQNTTHTYTAASTYQITLTVHDGSGATATTTTQAVITENSTEPQITLQHPYQGLYFLNTKLLPLQKTFIIGPMDITVDVVSYYPLARVKFLVDGELCSTDTEAPYSWRWTQRCCGRHVLKIIAVDSLETSSVMEHTVWKFF